MRTTRPHARPIAALLTPLVAVALLAGCFGGDDPTPEASTPAVPEASEPEPDPTEDDATEPEATSASGGAACLQGTWVSDPATLAAQTTSGLGMADVGAQATVTGDSRTTIAGDTVTTEYRDQVIEISWDMEGQQFRMVNTWTGTLTGTVAVTDERLEFTDVDASGLTVTYETFVNGVPLEVPGLTEIPPSGFAAGGANTYTCTGDELTIVPEVEGIDATDVTTVWHRER